MTEQLYYQDPFLTEFTGRVLTCAQEKNAWAVTLDRTAFYPEGGGQPADQGTLGEVKVLDVRERAGEDCEDMESLAAYRVCRRFAVPCLGLRIISNNELTGEAYRREVGEDLQDFLLSVLAHLGDQP